VKPAARECLGGRLRVLQVALHREVAAEHDLAELAAVRGDWLHALRVEHGHALLQDRADALATVALRLIGDRQRVPLVVARAQARRAVHFGQTIDMGEIEADALHAFDHRGGRRGATDERLHLVLDPAA
jgi:hypothetical protein